MSRNRNDYKQFEQFANSKVGIIVHNGNGGPVILHSILAIRYETSKFVVEFFCIGGRRRRYKHHRIYRREYNENGWSFLLVDFDLHEIEGGSLNV